MSGDNYMLRAIRKINVTIACFDGDHAACARRGCECDCHEEGETIKVRRRMDKMWEVECGDKRVIGTSKIEALRLFIAQLERESVYVCDGNHAMPECADPQCWHR